MALSGTETVAIVHDVVLVALAVIGCVNGFWAYRARVHAKSADAKGDLNAASIGDLKSSVNGRLTELLDVTRAGSYAAGQKQELVRATDAAKGVTQDC